MFGTNRKLVITYFVGLMLILLGVIGLSCIPHNDVNTRIDNIVKDNAFSIAGWEITNLFNELKQPAVSSANLNDITKVREYFNISAQLNTLESKRTVSEAITGTNELSSVDGANEADLLARKDALKPEVEMIIECQIRDMLTQDGICNPFLGNFSFPPVNFKLSTPPAVLVISPKEQIERLRDVMVLPDLSPQQINSIESQVDALGLSALVVPLGGLGATFPTFVQDNADLRFTISAAVEEWLHQYLAFKPLGFNYVLDSLGLTNNSSIVTVNETLASMVSDEIGDQIYDKYYASGPPAVTVVIGAKPSFDFNAAMRQIRLSVDGLLADGHVTQAEQYMEQKRQFLVTKGYYIRKLNQAYFAFYGSYADETTSVDPIGTKLKEIRNQSTSVADFLHKMVGFTIAS